MVASLPLQALRNVYSHSDDQQYPALRVYSSNSTTKIIHFVRHAEGHHNVAGRDDPLLGYLREDLEDASLTEQGVAQCKALRSESCKTVENAQLIVVSPMNRTMQTASISFAQLNGKIPWVAIEDLRERTGLHPCDRRRSISEHKVAYRHIDFSNVHEDKDPLYWKYRLREPNADVIVRAKRFMLWLKERPEKEIIVVTHHGYLLDLLGDVLHSADPADAKDFKNCEMRTFMVRF